MLGRRKVLLINWDVSSLVVDALCRRAVDENAAVACFYFDLTAQTNQSPAAILGSVLRQIVSGLEEVPEGVFEAFRGRVKGAGGRVLVLSEIVEHIQNILTSRRTFICLDALDQCRAGDRVNLLDLFNQILQKSPGTRIFLTGRPHIRAEVEKHLAGRAAVRLITPTRDDIVIFLRAKLKEDTMPDVMNKTLEEEIIEVIPNAVSET